MASSLDSPNHYVHKKYVPSSRVSKDASLTPNKRGTYLRREMIALHDPEILQAMDKTDAAARDRIFEDYFELTQLEEKEARIDAKRAPVLQEIEKLEKIKSIVSFLVPILSILLLVTGLILTPFCPFAGVPLIILGFALLAAGHQYLDHLDSQKGGLYAQLKKLKYPEYPEVTL